MHLLRVVCVCERERKRYNMYVCVCACMLYILYVCVYGKSGGLSECVYVHGCVCTAHNIVYKVYKYNYHVHTEVLLVIVGVWVNHDQYLHKLNKIP